MQPPYQPPQQPPYQPPFQPPQAPPAGQYQAPPPPEQRSVSVMDGLRFTTSGPNGWTNILFCALLYLSTQIVPVIGLIVMQGFFAEVHRRLVRRLPEPNVRFDFSDFTNYLTRGIAPFVVTLILALPFGILLVALIVAGVVLGQVGTSVGGGVDQDLVMLASLGALGFVSLPLCMFWFALSNAGVTRAELTGDVGKALKFGAIWAYAGRTWKRVLITSILMSFVSIGLTLLGLIACVVGLFATMGVAMIAQLHVRWQIYNEYLLEGGEPIELAAWETLPSEIKAATPYAAPVR